MPALERRDGAAINRKTSSAESGAGGRLRDFSAGCWIEQGHVKLRLRAYR